MSQGDIFVDVVLDDVEVTIDPDPIIELTFVETSPDVLVIASGNIGPPGQDGNTGAQGPEGEKGDTGSQGPVGETGPQGTPGEQWFTQPSGLPPPATGNVGDFMLNTLTGDFYEKTAVSTWTLRGNLKGPPGEKWSTGAGVPPGATGVVGDWYLDSSNGDYYEKTGTSVWTLRGNLKGPAGAKGDPGAQGPQGIQGPPGTTTIDDTNLPQRLRSIPAAPTTVYGNDLNNAKQNGWYQVFPDTLNRPDNAVAYWACQVNVIDAGSLFQTCYQHDSHIIKYRNLVGSVWSAWTTLSPSDDTNLPARIKSGTSLNVITDFNTAQKSGWYFIDAGTSVNAPAPGAWELEVIAYAEGNTICQQIAYGAGGDNQLWVRNMWYSGWQPWKKIFPIDNTNLPGRLASTANSANPPLAPTDLNAITSTGFYATAGNPLNAPEGGNFWYVICIARGDGWTWQQASGFYNGSVWVRRIENSAWTAWRKVSPVDDTSLPARIASTTWISNVSDAESAQAKQSGWYNMAPGALNGPDSSKHFLLEVIAGSGSEFQRQYAHHLYGNETWSRQNNGQPWVQTFPINDAGLPARLKTVASLGPNNLNAIQGSGWYSLQGGPNGPQGIAYVTVMHADYSGDGWYSFQIAQPLGYGYVWWRACYQGVWGAWRQFYDSANPQPMIDGFLPPRMKSVAGASTVADCNDMRENGVYGCNSALNRPPGSTLGAVEVRSWDSTGYCQQTFYSIYGTQVWKRTCAGGWGSWTAWQLIEDEWEDVGGSDIITTAPDGGTWIYWPGGSVTAWKNVVICNGDGGVHYNNFPIIVALDYTRGPPSASGFGVYVRTPTGTGSGIACTCRVNWSAKIRR